MVMKIDKDFRPEPEMRTLYFIYWVLVLGLGFIWWIVPLSLFAPLAVGAIVGGFFGTLFLVTLIWIPLYYCTTTEHF